MTFFSFNISVPFARLAVAIAALSIIPSGIAQAEAAPSLASSAANANSSASSVETVNCFEHYHFGSVQAHLATPTTNSVSGVPLTFSGTLTNDNPYPIVDGALYVKIFRSRGASKDVDGPDVVDQFLVQGDIIIPAKGSVPISFTWQVPAQAQTGDYALASFFTTSRKFNLLGLSFTDDVVGNRVPFRILGEASGGLQLDKAGVRVNGQPFHFAAFPPRVEKGEQVVITALIKNTTDADEFAHISWTIYQWDAQLAENVVQVENSLLAVAVPKHGQMPVSVTISDTRFPVYYAVGTVTWRDTKSIIGVRFVRNDISRPRLNFPGISTFPLKAGKSTTVFSCLHEAGNGSEPDGKLAITLTDRNGKVIHEYTYKGPISNAMMGVGEQFTPEQDYDRFTLDARLYQGSQFIDEAHLDYDCNLVDPSLCAQSGQQSRLVSILDQAFAIRYWLVTILVVALIVVATAILVRSRVHRPVVKSTDV